MAKQINTNEFTKISTDALTIIETALDAYMHSRKYKNLISDQAHKPMQLEERVNAVYTEVQAELRKREGAFMRDCRKPKTNFDFCCESIENMAQIIDIAKIGWTKEQITKWLQAEAHDTLKEKGKDNPGWNACIDEIVGTVNPVDESVALDEGNNLEANKRNKLAALLVELDLNEVHHELNRFMDKKDTEKALEMQNVKDSITTILDYLAK